MCGGARRNERIHCDDAADSGTSARRRIAAGEGVEAASHGTDVGDIAEDWLSAGDVQAKGRRGADVRGRVDAGLAIHRAKGRAEDNLQKREKCSGRARTEMAV